MYEEAIGEDHTRSRCDRADLPLHHGWPVDDFNQMTSIRVCSPAASAPGRTTARTAWAPTPAVGFRRRLVHLPFSVPNYLGPLLGQDRLSEDAAEVTEALDRAQARLDKLMSIGGTHGAEYFHRQLGEELYRVCGVARNKEDLAEGLAKIRELRKQFWSDLFIPGNPDEMNQQLEYANRVADYLDLGELMCVDALDRDESCGAHYREDHIDEEGEAQRDDENWCFVSAWEPAGDGGFIRHAEPLYFESIPLQTRNYK